MYLTRYSIEFLTINKDYYSDADILNMIREGQIKSDRRVNKMVVTPTHNNEGLQSRLTDRMNMTMRNKFNRNFTGCKNTSLPSKGSKVENDVRYF